MYGQQALRYSKTSAIFFGTHDLEKNKTQPAGMTSPEDYLKGGRTQLYWSRKFSNSDFAAKRSFF